MRPSRFALMVAIAANAVAIAYYWATAPELLASHFDASGSPDGYSSKTAFFGLWALLAAVFPLAAVASAAAQRSMPNSAINMPYKELWLAPERREDTLRQLGDMIAWLMSVVSLFTTFMMVGTVRANLQARVRFDIPPVLFVLVLLAALAAVVGPYLLRWSRPPLSR